MSSISDSRDILLKVGARVLFLLESHIGCYLPPRKDLPIRIPFRPIRFSLLASLKANGLGTESAKTKFILLFHQEWKNLPQPAKKTESQVVWIRPTSV
jgi:hypothetical protein